MEWSRVFLGFYEGHIVGHMCFVFDATCLMIQAVSVGEGLPKGECLLCMHVHQQP